MAKFIFVTGGVVSGLGKGITAASLGRLLKCRGLKVASQKLAGGNPPSAARAAWRCISGICGKKSRSTPRTPGI